MGQLKRDRAYRRSASSLWIEVSTQEHLVPRSQRELEHAESRVLAGFHFRFAIETGVKVGCKIGQFAAQHALRPLKEHATRLARLSPRRPLS
jgi:hypothetical protein